MRWEGYIEVIDMWDLKSKDFIDREVKRNWEGGRKEDKKELRKGGRKEGRKECSMQGKKVGMEVEIKEEGKGGRKDMYALLYELILRYVVFWQTIYQYEYKVTNIIWYNTL